MPVFKLQPMYNHSVRGWAESYFTPNVSTSSLSSLINGFCLARNNTLFTDNFWQGIRVSQVDPTKLSFQRQSTLLLPGTGVFNPFSGTAVNIPTNGTIVGPSGILDEAILNAALVANVQYADKYIARHYISPVPKQWMGTEPATMTGVDAEPWNSAIANFYIFLRTNGFQILHQDLAEPSLRMTALGPAVLSNATPPQLGITVLDPVAPGLVPGSFVQLSFFRPPKGTRLPTINGRWGVQAVQPNTLLGTTTIYLINSEQLVPSQVRFTPKSQVRLVTYRLDPIQNIWDSRVTTRRRGRPSTAPRGRRLTRATLDP